MDLVGTLSGMPGAVPFDGLPDAWHWSPNRRFNFVAALNADREHVLQINTIDRFDPDLVRAVLAFAREHGAELFADKRPLIPLLGFAYTGFGFDTVVAVSPDVHQYHERDNAELHELTDAVFPAWHYEFSGTEPADEARFRYGHPQGVRSSRLDREPSPYLKMRYDNTRTKSGSIGPDRGFTKLATLNRELELLDGTADSFVEFENYRGEVWRVEWAGTWVLIGDDGRRTIDLPELLTFAHARLTE
jgi:hypothetical protein